MTFNFNYILMIYKPFLNLNMHFPRFDWNFKNWNKFSLSLALSLNDIVLSLKGWNTNGVPVFIVLRSHTMDFNAGQIRLLVTEFFWPEHSNEGGLMCKVFAYVHFHIWIENQNGNEVFSTMSLKKILGRLYLVLRISHKIYFRSHVPLFNDNTITFWW